MASMTESQKVVVSQLEQEYGRTDMCLIVDTPRPTAIVRCVWYNGFMNKPRILDIKPNGTRQVYDDARV